MPEIGGGSPGFSVARRVQKGVLVVVIRGEVDTDTTPQLTHDFEAAVNASGAIVVDLCGASFMDSSGLYALLVLRRRLAARSRRLALALWPDGAVATILHVAGVDELFEAYPSRIAAVEAVSA